MTKSNIYSNWILVSIKIKMDAHGEDEMNREIDFFFSVNSQINKT